jgi:hypothetical protein
MYLIRLIVLVLLMTSASAYACSCKKFWVEEIANQNNLVLTKLKIVQPTFLEKLKNIANLTSPTSRHKVEVLENIKGVYAYDYLDVYDNFLDWTCSVNLSSKEEIYVVNGYDTNGLLTHDADVCNLVTEEFSREVATYIKDPKVKPMNTDFSRWRFIYKDNVSETNADISNLSWDTNGAYLWLMQNSSKSNVDLFGNSAKSRLMKLQFSCKEKKMNVVTEIDYSEHRAKGYIVKFRNYSKNGIYSWMDVNDNYAKAMKIVCR